jgi:ketosteroid isomerase-like protein
VGRDSTPDPPRFLVLAAGSLCHWAAQKRRAPANEILRGRCRRRNVEALHQAVDAFNRRDLDAFLALCDPGVEFISYWMQVEGGGPYRGHDGVREWWEGLLAVYPDFRGEIEEVRDRGDRTIARMRVHGRGVESDVPIDLSDQAMWQVAGYRHGKVIWWRFVGSEAGALEAAGLSE